MSPILNPAHGRSRLIRRAALVTLAFAAALAVWGSLAAEGGRSTSKRAAFVTPTIGSVIVNGAVAKPMTLSLSSLEALPQRTMPVTFLSGTNPVANTETGPLLADVLALAQPKFHKTCPNDRLRFYVVVTASDGYASILSWGEIDPGSATGSRSSRSSRTASCRQGVREYCRPATLGAAAPSAGPWR